MPTKHYRQRPVEKDAEGGGFSTALGLTPYNLQGPENGPVSLAEEEGSEEEPRFPKKKQEGNQPKRKTKSPHRPVYTSRPLGVPRKANLNTYEVFKAPTGVMVGFWLPEEVAERLVLPDGERADRLHLTVCFLGEMFLLEPAQLAAVIPTVWEVCRNFEPLHAQFSGVGRFEDVGRGLDVLYASVDAPGLPELYTALCSALAANGVAPSRMHGLSPHVSLKYIDSDDRTPLHRVTGPWYIDHLTVAIGPQRVDIPLVRKPFQVEPVPLLAKGVFDDYLSLSGMVNSMVATGQLDEREGSMLLHRFRDGRMSHDQIINYVMGLVAGHDNRAGHWVSVSNGGRTFFLYANGYGAVTKGPEATLGTSIYDLRPVKGVWSVHHLASGKEPPKGALKEIVDLHATQPLDKPNDQRPTRSATILQAALLTLFNMPEPVEQPKPQR